MVCPVCNVEAVIKSTNTVLNKEEMKLYMIFHFSCRNKKCKEFNKDIGEERTEIPFEIED